MPALADYCKNNGNIIDATNCAELLATFDNSNTTDIDVIVPIELIHLPSTFFLSDRRQDTIDAKVDEFNMYGDFIDPLKIKKGQTGYLLIDCFEQFLAAQELGLSECRCLVAPN